MNTTTPPPNAPLHSHPQINPSPKQRFLGMSGRTISQHRDMVSSDQFDLSSDFALAEMVRQLVEKSDGSQYYAMAAFLRIQGATEYLSQMKRLAEPVALATPPASTPSNLRHNA